MILAIDAGTTHCKAAVFGLDGTAHRVVRQLVVMERSPDGPAYLDVVGLWASIEHVVRQATDGLSEPVRAVGVASMAESGLLLDRRTGEPRTQIVPWFDTSAQPQTDRIAANSDPVEFYVRSGLRVSYKASLAKILWLRDRDPDILSGAVWLSVADFIVYKLTGQLGTDHSLAGRTGAFDIWHKQWDAEWLARFELTPDLFPPAYPSGTPVGGTLPELAHLGIPIGTPAAVAGHDHLCAAYALGPEAVLDSMGTAEVMTGAFPERRLTQADYDSGLLSGCHVIPEHNYWLGALSTSGGAVDWQARLLSDGAPQQRFDEFSVGTDRTDNPPTGILFFPYLLGRGAPHSDPHATGAFVGLKSHHTRDHLRQAVYEGTAFELEGIRRAGEAFSRTPIDRVTIAGGGARNWQWTRIKADISGVVVSRPIENELTLLGAAAAAAVGAGVYPGMAAIRELAPLRPDVNFAPNAAVHERYVALFDRYCQLQAPLRRFGAAEGTASL